MYGALAVIAYAGFRLTLSTYHTLLRDAQACGEYLGGYRVRQGEGRPINLVCDADTDEECLGTTRRLQHDGDIVEVPLPVESTQPIVYFRLSINQRS